VAAAQSGTRVLAHAWLLQDAHDLKARVRRKLKEKHKAAMEAQGEVDMSEHHKVRGLSLQGSRRCYYRHCVR
jgi:hypothetical protein